MDVIQSGPVVYLCPTRECDQLLALAVGVGAHLGDRGRVGVFRPIAPSPGDPLAAAIAQQLGTRIEVGPQPVSAAELLADPDAAMARIIEAWSQISARHEAMVVIGSEFDGPLAPVGFAWHTRIAANLGIPLTLVVPCAGGAQRINERVNAAVDEALRNHARVAGFITVRSAHDCLTTEDLGQTCVPGFVVDRITPQGLGQRTDDCPTVDATLLAGPAATDWNTGDVLVADSGLADLLDVIEPGQTVICDAARTDLGLGLAIGLTAGGFTHPGAVVMAGAGAAGEVVRLWDRLKVPVPLLSTPCDVAEVSASCHAAGGCASWFTAVQCAEAKRIVGAQVDIACLISAKGVVGDDDVVTPMMFEHRLLSEARKADRHIVLPEGTEERILKAADRLVRDRICRLTLLGDPEVIERRRAELGLCLDGVQIINPATSELLDSFARRYAELRAKKGVTFDQAKIKVADVSYFGTMMVLENLADGMVSGSVNTTAHTIRPALEVIRTAPGTSVVSSAFLMCLADRVLVFGDCAVNPNPTPEQVADIAISSARTAEQFGIIPRVAMLSYSTGSSGSGPDVDATVEATRLVREKAPDLLVDGPLQYDAATTPSVARTKMPDSPVAGRATVFVFPDLKTGNTTYKAVQRSANALAVGPVLQGLNKPVNDLSRGALVSDIVNTVAITAIQAGMK